MTDVTTNRQYKVFDDGTMTNRFRVDGYTVSAWDPQCRAWTATHDLGTRARREIRRLAEEQALDDSMQWRMQ